MREHTHPAERRMSAEEWDHIRNILVVRLDNIGDVVLLGPALRALRAHAPRASLTLLASPAGTEIAPLLPAIDDVITYRPEWQDGSDKQPFDPQQLGHLVMRLAKRRFDAAVIFTSFSQSPHPPALVAYLAGIPRRIGQSKEFGGALLTHWVTPLPDSVHQADRNLYLLETAGVPSVDTRLTLRVREKDRRSAAALLGAQGVTPHDRVLLAAPGASCSARRYDAQRFADAMALVSARDPGAVKIVVTGSSKERRAADMIVRQCPDACSLAGMTSLPEVVALVERASAVVCTNSSALHLADALDTPVLALYSGAEETEQWRPRHAPAVLLGRAVECAPCHRFECDRGMPCLDIPPEEVAEHALRLLRFEAADEPARTLTGATA